MSKSYVYLKNGKLVLAEECAYELVMWPTNTAPRMALALSAEWLNAATWDEGWMTIVAGNLNWSAS